MHQCYYDHCMGQFQIAVQLSVYPEDISKMQVKCEVKTNFDDEFKEYSVMMQDHDAVMSKDNIFGVMCGQNQF